MERVKEYFEFLFLLTYRQDFCQKFSKSSLIKQKGEYQSGVLRKQSTSYFPQNKHFLPPGTHSYGFWKIQLQFCSYNKEGFRDKYCPRSFHQFFRAVFIRTLLRHYFPLHKKWSFPLMISSVNVTKSGVFFEFGYILLRNRLCSDCIFASSFIGKMNKNCQRILRKH